MSDTKMSNCIHIDYTGMIKCTYEVKYIMKYCTPASLPVNIL